MNKRIIASLAMIALVIAGVTSATVAYFSDVAVRGGNTFSMGTVDVTHIGGLPFMLKNMIPGEQKVSGLITVRNTGSISIDLYVGERDTTPIDGKEANFQNWVDYAIDEVDCGDESYVRPWVGWQDVSFLFSTWNKVGENISASTNKCYKVYVTPKASMPNEFQGKRAITDVILYAVQAGSPAPGGQPWNWSGP